MDPHAPTPPPRKTVELEPLEKKRTSSISWALIIGPAVAASFLVLLGEGGIVLGCLIAAVSGAGAFHLAFTRYDGATAWVLAFLFFFGFVLLDVAAFFGGCACLYSTGAIH